ncbi:MAG: DJ-1/PfpI family protein [Clostridiales bacterium]|nr:DJ-1/PfpI family protein [Clostridiales bacterium]
MAKKVALFIADGTEETEAITPADLLRRAGIDVDIVSVMDRPDITASRGVRITADKVIRDIVFNDYDLLILPGGVKGTENLNSNNLLKANIRQFYDENKGIAAICAAPTIFAEMGLLNGRNATCNPGFREVLRENGAVLDEESKVVTDGNIITSQAMGTSVDFGLAIVSYLKGEKDAYNLKDNIRF